MRNAGGPDPIPSKHEKAPRLREGLFLGEGLGRGALGP
jgi:hypothetical protein